MFSRTLLIIFAFSISVVCSSRMLGPSPNHPLTKIYIVEVDSGLYHGDCNQYKLLLRKVLHGRSPKHPLLYCYKEVISGFAAELTDEEAEILKHEKGVDDVVHEKIYFFDDGPHSHWFPQGNY